MDEVSNRFDPAAPPAQDSRARQAPAYAALDLGTNNCRLLIGAPTAEGFRVLDSYSRVVRLGEGLHGTGRLSDGAMERAVSALQACVTRLERRQIRGLRAIATEACRRATNGRAFLQRVHDETGLHVEIISSREEAELALESCAPLLRGGGQRALLFDIGGGSTELAWVRLSSDGQRPQLIGYTSMPVGVVTLAERFGKNAFDGATYDAMVEDVLARLRPFEAVHCIGHEIRNGNVNMLGTSGTVTTLAGIALQLQRYSRPQIDGVLLSAEAAREAVRRLREMGESGVASHPCVGPERADFVLPGCAIFSAIHQLWPVPHVLVADRGLREGILLRMMRAERTRTRYNRRAAAFATGAAIPISP